jgi:hypothetical protein
MWVLKYLPWFGLKKVFTKVGTNRVSTISESAVQPTQRAFMTGRHVSFI